MRYPFVSTASLPLIGCLSLGAAHAQEAKPGWLSPSELTQIQAALLRLVQQRASTTQDKTFIRQHRFDFSAAADGARVTYTTQRRSSCKGINAENEHPFPWPERLVGLSRGWIVAALMPNTAPRRGPADRQKAPRSACVSRPGQRRRQAPVDSGVDRQFKAAE